MFDHTLQTSNTKLEEAIDKLLTQMLDETCESEEYAKMADQLVKLYKAKELDSKINVSEFDSINKQDDLNGKYIQNEIDTQQKHAEWAETTRIRDEELRLKAKELNLKDEESAGRLQQIEVELEMKKEEHRDRRRVSPDTLALVGANIAGIVLIIGYERMNVIASKALGFVSKLR